MESSGYCKKHNCIVSPTQVNTSGTGWRKTVADAHQVNQDQIALFMMFSFDSVINQFSLSSWAESLDNYRLMKKKNTQIQNLVSYGENEDSNSTYLIGLL